MSGARGGGFGAKEDEPASISQVYARSQAELEVVSQPVAVSYIEDVIKIKQKQEQQQLAQEQLLKSW